MEKDVFPIGSRVCVTNESPFKGRKGTILAIHMIATPGEPTCCFYKVALDEAHLQVPLWFEYQEVVPIGTTCEQPPTCGIIHTNLTKLL